MQNYFLKINGVSIAMWNNLTTESRKQLIADYLKDNKLTR
jgi:hypothetical protein